MDIVAEAALSILFTNLEELIKTEDVLLTEVKEKIEWIQTEFRPMVAYSESIDALHHLPDETNEWMERTRTVIRRAEDLIDTYAKTASQSKMAAVYKKPVYWSKQRNLSKELGRIKDEIIQVRRGWRSVDFASSSISHQCRASASPDSACSAMTKLDSALQVGISIKKVIEWVRDELVPLHDFLQEIESEGVEVLGERQKIWMQELKNIFQFIDESFPCSQGSSKIPFFHQFLLRQVVSELQAKILQLYRRYYAYGFGEILVNNGTRSISPIIRMYTPIPDVSKSGVGPDMERFMMSFFSFICILPTQQRQIMRMTHPSWLTPGGRIKLLRVDLSLMKALLKDTRSMKDLDERVNVWLNQIQEISAELEATDKQASKGRKGLFERISDRMVMPLKLRKIGYEIRDITARKMTYGIGSALREAGLFESIAASSFVYQPYKLSVNQFPKFSSYSVFLEAMTVYVGLVDSLVQLRRRVKSVSKELDLMHALVQDVDRMKIDARLKFWMEEMLRAQREAKEVVELARKKSPYKRIQAASRINKIKNHILILSRWKHTYDIDMTSRRGSTVFEHDLKEAEPYPSRDLEYGQELIRRETNLMEALDSGIVKMDKLDGTSKAWLEEMLNIAEDAKTLTGTKVNFPDNWFPNSKFASDVDRLKEKMRQLLEIKIAYRVELRQRLPPNIVRQIKEKLLADNEHSCVIPIAGMRHTQKEALQNLIYDDYAITRHFEWHAWVNVPEEFSDISISEYVATQIMEQQCQEEIPIGEQLMQMLSKRCLIILDEIQTVEAWRRFRRAFQQISTGSRIILISNEHTCSLLDSTSDTTFEGPVIIRDVMPGSDASNIPLYLRRCLYYFLLFPANFEVPTRRLIVLWVAEGLVHSKNGSDSLEHVAEHYLNELIDRGKVCAMRKKQNGKVKACQLSDGTRDKLLKMAKDARFFQDANGIISRLVDHHDTSDSCFIQIHGNPSYSASVPNYRNVLTFLSFDTQEGSKPGEDIGDFLRKCISAGCFRWMRVLDLERVFRPKLPKALSKLTLLRYLGLRWTYLENLPDFVNMFLNLQVLDVKHTYISILPKSIWRMQFLRHLYLSETYRTRFKGHPSDISLNELQTLWGAFIDENTCVTGGLDTLHNLRKLGLLCRPSKSSQPSRMVEQLKAVDKWISGLKYLESLRLKSRDVGGNAAELHLSSLKEKENLSTIYLLGRLEQSVVTEFPANLTDITLSGSGLAEDPMEALGKLPKLLILRLLSGSVVVSTMRCRKNSFCVLKVLKIWMLDNLEKLEAEEGSLSSLKELEIRSCDKLEKLPNRLQRLLTEPDAMAKVLAHFTKVE